MPTGFVSFIALPTCNNKFAAYHSWFASPLLDLLPDSQTRAVRGCSSAVTSLFVPWCVDWLRTATAYTKQTSGCPGWDCRVSDMLVLRVFSLVSLRTGKVSAACSCCRTYSHWTG